MQTQLRRCKTQEFLYEMQQYGNISTVKILIIGTYICLNKQCRSDQTSLKEQSNQIYTVCHSVHLLEALLHCKIKLFYIKDNYGS